MREGRLVVGGNPFLGHAQGELVLSEEDMEAGQLRKDRVPGGAFEAGNLGFQQRDRLLGLAAFEESPGFEKKPFGMRV